jgi:hypothetical protein
MLGVEDPQAWTQELFSNPPVLVTAVDYVYHSNARAKHVLHDRIFIPAAY